MSQGIFFNQWKITLNREGARDNWFFQVCLILDKYIGRTTVYEGFGIPRIVKNIFNNESAKWKDFEGSDSSGGSDSFDILSIRLRSNVYTKK